MTRLRDEAVSQRIALRIHEKRKHKLEMQCIYARMAFNQQMVKDRIEWDAYKEADDRKRKEEKWDIRDEERALHDLYMDSDKGHKDISNTTIIVGMIVIMLGLVLTLNWILTL